MKRESNFELLRIILMLLIIAWHVIMYNGSITSINTLDYFTSNFITSFAIIAVNAFVLLSGYFSIS